MQKLGEREPVRSVNPLAAAPSLAAQFFLIPLSVVVVIFAIYGGFRMMVADERSPEEYLADVSSGGRDRRWPAAYELSRLMDDPETEERFPELGPALLRAFIESEGDDPRVRRYLALAIGRLGHPPSDAVAILTDALGDPDPETLISVIWALASLGDELVVPRIVDLYQVQDAGVRKMVVYALGVLPDDGVHTTLRAALQDPVPDVQWNAAVSLARHGDVRGLVVLQRMLDREYVSKQVTPSGNVADPVGEVMISGVRAVAALGQDGRTEVVRPTLAALADADESLKVRQAAMEAIAALEGGSLGERVADRQ